MSAAESARPLVLRLGRRVSGSPLSGSITRDASPRRSGQADDPDHRGIAGKSEVVPVHPEAGVNEGELIV